MARAKRGSENAIRSLDLTGRERHLRAAMQAMTRISARFCRSARRALPFLARRKGQLVAEGVAIADPERAGGLRFEVALEALDGTSWGNVAFDAPALAAVLDGMLGGDAEERERPAVTELTLAQRALLTRVGRAVAEQLAQAVAEEGGAQFSIAAAKVITEDEPLDPRLHEGLSVRCKLEGPGNAGYVTIALGVEALERAAEAQPEAPEISGDPRLVQALADVPLELVVELGRVQLGLRQVLALRPGQVLRLPTATDDNIRVLIGEQAKFSGTPVVSRGQLSVEIRGRASEPQPGTRRAEGSGHNDEQ